MTAAQQGIKEVGIKVGLKFPAVHLHRQLVHQDDSHSQSAVYIIVTGIYLAGCHYLGQTFQGHVGHRQAHIGQDQDPLLYEFLLPPVPDRQAVVPIIKTNYFMYCRKGLAAAEIPTEDIQGTGGAAVEVLHPEVLYQIQDGIPDGFKRMTYAAAEGRRNKVDQDKAKN